MTYTITPLIAEDAICERVRELAASIDRAMAGKPYILLLLLNGALPFAAMLEKHLKSRPVVKAVKISSYAGMEKFRFRGMGGGLRGFPARCACSGGG